MLYGVKSRPSTMQTMAEHIGWDPNRIKLLWGEREKPRRGPKPTLDVPSIVTAAIGIANADGLEALSMQRLASDLGVGTMTLYTYIPDKGTLLELMIDACFEGAVAPYRGEGWREYLTNAALSIFDTYRRHPWTLQVFIGGPPTGPHQLTFLEDALHAFGDTPLPVEFRIDVVMGVTSYVRGSALISTGIQVSESESALTADELALQYAENLHSVLSPERFPLLHEVFNPETFVTGEPPEGWTDDLGFRFGLERYLDGLESYLEAQ